MGMAVADSRIGAHHIDVAAAGGVPDVSPLTAREHDRKRFIIVSAVPALKFHCVHGHNSDRLDCLYLGVCGDRSRGTSGVTRRILHLDGLMAAKTAAYVRLSHSGAPPKVASPESMTLGRWLWIPGSPHPISGLPEIGTVRCAHRQQPMCGGAPGMMEWTAPDGIISAKLVVLIRSSKGD